MITRRDFGRVLGGTGLALATPSLVRAQGAGGQWPDRPVRLVVPYAAGGTNDILARLYGQKLGEKLGQPVVVENRAGAQGIVGTEAVSTARPDGYTLLLGAMGPIVYNPATYERLPYDSMRDLMPVCRMVVVPVTLVVGANSPYRDLNALLEAGRTKPDGLTYGTSSAAFQLPTELLNQRARTRMIFVAYRSAADSINAAANGEVDIGVMDTGAISAALQGGRIRALTVLSPTRDPNFPDIPAISEQGYPDFDANTFSGLFAPAGTPAAIVDRLAGLCDGISAEADLKEKMQALGMTPSPQPRAEFSRYIAERIPFWRDVAKRAGLQLER
ncbi:Bug family tripartite tricarboxylate transporter substrate binding protein [Roseomonas sp. BN140053]|uniref:Bug family tripartite tricarboxylate transporter substrate binding protein n=1 Tax=Roseomonas sp. BN140053 TaxID=3391898 RepID=UPI0039EB6B67